MRKIFLLLLLLSVVASGCEGSVVFYVPAVAGGEGSFIQARMSAWEGNSTFFEIPPYVGITTQNSFTTAVGIAKKIAKKECSFGISFPEKEVKNVDGPSGGVIFTVYAYSLLANVTPREDAIITGSVDENGAVGSVGGVYEKASRSKIIGKRYFVAPRPSISEYMLTRELEDENFTIVYISNVKEAIDFMFHNITPEAIKLKRTEKIPEEDNPWSVDGFDGIAVGMIAKEESELGNLSLPVEVYNYVEESISIQKALLRKGYEYSAANDAFVVLMDIRTIKDSNSKTLEEKAREVEECLNATDIEEKREDNFEWIAGAEARKKWAERQVKSVRAAKPELKEEKYVLMNKLEYALGWCEIAGQLNKKGKGKVMNESVYREKAKEIIDEVEKEVVVVDAVEHIENAKELYGEGKYLAAGYEALFAKAINDARTGRKEGVKEEYKTMWGKLYGSQALFSGSAEVANLANNLEVFFTEVEDEAVWEEKEEDNGCGSTAAILAVLFAAVMAKKSIIKCFL
jgi:predicted S18 family serine protease